MPTVLNEFIGYLAGKPLVWHLYVSQIILGFGMIVDTVEHLANLRHFRAGGIFAGRIFSTGYDDYNFRPFRFIRELLCRERVFSAMICLRLAILLLVMLPAQSSLFYTLCLSPLLIIEILLSYRCWFGRDGSDQMDLMVLVGLLAAYILLPRESAAMGLWFIALQTVLSYMSSGIAKIVSPVWRSGDAFFRIFNTYVYGSKALGSMVLKFPFVGVFACWAIIIFECLFIFVLVIPTRFVLLFILIGILFHLFNAIVMGLNKFFWSWAASYPALLYCSIQAARLLYD